MGWPTALFKMGFCCPETFPFSFCHMKTPTAISVILILSLHTQELAEMFVHVSPQHCESKNDTANGDSESLVCFSLCILINTGERLCGCTCSEGANTLLYHHL